MFKLTWRNAIRHPLRSGLTVLGMALAVLAFCILRTVVAAWYAGVDAASPVRLVTRNAVSPMSPLPLSYLAKIQAVPGVTRVGYAYWFEGIYLDKKNFFPQFAASLPQYLNLAPELIIPPDQRLALIKDRQGCLAGRKLVKRFGWKPGEVIVLKGTYFQGEFRFTLRAVYTGRDPGTDETMFFFHWDYLNEYLKKTAPERADQVGWFLVEITRPELAATVSERIDAAFKNSLAETLTETEKAFNLGFVEMTKAILIAIQAVSWAVIGVILAVLANTMAMSARERLGEYAVLKTLGFRPWHLAGLILGESLLLALMGGLLGLALVVPALRLFPEDLSQYFPGLEIGPATAALGLSVALAVGVLAALLPAWRATRVRVAEALRKVG
jgi:putative ABC transport system permease protein|uniref:ABC transporter permease n=1 Tax=Desulfobacca acetoxidans TaxID=60893 RepID=A0A7C3SHT6_9BACT